MKRLSRADILIIGGVLLITGGAAWIFPPAGAIVLGTFAVVIGIALDIAHHRQKPHKRGSQ